MKSSFESVPIKTNIDFSLLELTSVNNALCCMYCPPKIKPNEITAVIEYLKSLTKFPLVVSGDFNVNLLEENNNVVIEFVNSLHLINLYPTITLPTRVTSISATLIDNIVFDSSFLPAYSHVIRTDISDYFLTVLLLHFSKSNIMANRRNFCVTNKTNFTNKLRRANWNHLFSLHDADSTFNHFIKKLKLKFNKSFPYEPVNNTIKKPLG